MTSFETLIANHYVINLDERNDRLISYEVELKKIRLEGDPDLVFLWNVSPCVYSKR